MTEKTQREWGSGNYTTHCYAVEARSTYGEIVCNDAFGTVVLTRHEWKRVNVRDAPRGVQNHLEFYPEALKHGFMTYAAAMAIAYGLQATQEHARIETRLVQIEFKCEYTTRELGLSEPFESFEADRQLYWRLREQARTADAVDPVAASSHETSTRVK